ncbi:MAG TPA: aminoglycoside phosphotransferase family protein [Rugosimonospora sp.]|nr:aminoglycoside phosphotransferase family protein [Rugosimonospora sp.]
MVERAITPAVAQALVGNAVPGFRVTGVAARGGGEVHRVYEVRGTGPDRPLVVKVYDERWPSAADHWRSKLCKEVFVYGLLTRHGIQAIPRVLRHEPAGVPALPSAFAVMTVLDGQPLSTVADQLDVRDTDRVYEHLGRLLAVVHQIRARRWGHIATGLVDVKPSNTAYMRDRFATLLRRFTRLGAERPLADAISRHVGRHADLFAACQQPTLCHNDFHQGNVLVARDGPEWRVSGYVDVENAVAADPLLDLAKTDYYALRDQTARRRAFLRGYGSLPDDWAERLAIYRLHHAVEFWNWSAGTGKADLLPAIRLDVEELLSARP